MGVATMPIPSTRRLTTLSLQLGEDGKAPLEFRIFKMGINESEKGSFLFDELAAEAVISAYERLGKPMVIDYNHGTTFEEPTPEQARAAASSFVPEVRPDGLWATSVNWTARGRESVESREYTLISPAFVDDKKTGRVLRLVNLALTNWPALNNVEPLVAANALEDSMDPELKKALERIAELERQLADAAPLRATAGQLVALSGIVGLGAAAGAEDLRTKITALAGFRRDVLAIAGKETETEAIGVLTALKASNDQLVALRKQLDDEKITRLSGELKTVLDGACEGKEAKLTPAERKLWEKEAQDDGIERTLVKLRAHLEVRGPLPGGQRRTPTESGDVGMTDQQKHVAAVLRISEKDWNARP